jgi:hypothetical protein
MGEENGPLAGLTPKFIVEVKLAPVTLSNLFKREGGSTISRRALDEVVKGWPPASSVSSNSYGFCIQGEKHWGDGYSTDLINHVEVIPQSSSRDGTKVFSQDIDECLHKCESSQRVHYKRSP